MMLSYNFMIAFSFLSILVSSSNQYKELCEGFLPENDLYIPTDVKAFGGVNETEFNRVLDKVYQVYAPKVREYGGNLVIERDWSDGTVNAYAQRNGRSFIIKMLGGLARHSAITSDGLALVACHEIGHHIGGAPNYTGNWASTEGQSDYFATLKCLRFVFENDDNETIVNNLNPSSYVVNKCEERFGNREDQLICMRTSIASMSGARLFASLGGGGSLSYERPDSSVVSKTYESHPASQCRLDTYFNGSLCDVDPSINVENNNPNTGTCNRKSNDEEGLRPLCWYYPNLSTNPNPNPPDNNDSIAMTPTFQGLDHLTTSNPYSVISLKIDISSFSNAYGVAIEVSKPNTSFSNPNGRTLDSINSLGHVVFAGTSGIYNISPARQLPGWGRYEIRVIALDRNSRAVSRFSDSFVLVLTP